MTTVREPHEGAILAAAQGARSESALRAWFYLVWLCIQRQARVRQMVWIALALLAVTATVIALTTMAGRWGMYHWRWLWVRPTVTPNLRATAKDKQAPSLKSVSQPEPQPPRRPRDLPPGTFVIARYDEIASGLEKLSHLTPGSGLVPWSGLSLTASASGLQLAVASASKLSLDRSPFYIFSTWVVFNVFLGFLLPIWSLSFATEALGGDREGRTLIWLLTRPLPRWSIYLAKFVALLPWSLGFNLGGFLLLCLLAGPPGQMAFRLYWPAVLAGTVTFCALFHLMSALFRRAAVIALVYSFFLETILGNMPGYMKRVSISFYTRCLLFDAAGDYGLQPEQPTIYLPVDGPTAWGVLLALTLGLLLVGMVVFSRFEYQDVA